MFVGIRMIHEFLRKLSQEKEVAGDIIALKRITLMTFLWLIIAEAIMVFQIYPTKQFLDELQRGVQINTLVWFLGSIFALYTIGSIVRGEMDTRRHDFYWRMWSMLWGHGHRKELRLDTAWHIAHSTGEKESILDKNITKVEHLVDNFIFDTLPTVLRVLFTSIGVSFLGWHFGVLSFSSVFLFVAMMMYNERQAAPLRKASRKQMKRIERDGSELTQNWRTLKQFGIEEIQNDEHAKLLTRFYTDEMVRHRKYINCFVRQEHVVSISRVIMYFVVFWTFVPARGIGEVVLSIMWMERVFSNMYRLSDFQRRLNEGVEACRELIELFAIVPEVGQPEHVVVSKESRGHIEIKNVSFSYPEGKQDALCNINLVIEPKMTVAFVGSSGSGKTTLASLLLREFDPQEGQILVDGVDLRDWDYTKYRRETIGIVTQNVELFDLTIRENIRMVRPDAPEKYEEVSARRAFAEEFISLLPNGYDTMTGEDGVHLSGGQRQRLAIARALYRDPDILILDEATSSLDAISQEHIQKAIDQAMVDRACTTLIIAHRFSTIMNADLVVVLNDGKIEEIGTHQELAKINGIYKRLLDLETRGVFG